MLAALVLLFVGIWMHGKAQADEWQRYIREKLGNAVAGGSAWFLFLLAFIAVYREIFETILFYVALAAEGNVGSARSPARLSGAVAARGNRGRDAEVQPAPADRRNSSPTARRWSRCSRSCSPARASPRSRKRA